MPRIFGLVVLGLVGCANRYTLVQLDAGTAVHTFRRDYSNAFVVVRDGHAFMIDSGLADNSEQLVEDLTKARIAPSTLRAIILTHGHADHSGGANTFKRRFHVPVVVGEGDVAMLASGHNDRLCPTNQDARDRLASDQAATFEPFAPDTIVGSERSLEPLVGVPGLIVLVPGHTAGSLAVVIPSAKAAFVGDLFRGSVFGWSAEVHFYMCDLEGNRRDIERLLDSYPGVERFFTGHFGELSRDAVLDLLRSSRRDSK